MGYLGFKGRADRVRVEWVDRGKREERSIG
jgi:hypothetical protein